MKNSAVKRLSCLFLVLVCAVTCLTLPSIDASAVSKPSKTSITSLKRLSKSAVRLNWKKSSRAKGYVVYMKTNNGGYKTIKTTSSRALTKTGLKIGSSYYFKVRPYTTYKGKRYYGVYSSVRKIKMNSYVYLVDVVQPYSVSDYELYRGTEPFKMGGLNYYQGFTICGEYGRHDRGYATYNLQGKYSKMTFVYGGYEGHDGDMTTMIYEDGDLVKTLRRKKDSLPRSYSINVKDCYKYEVHNSDWIAGFGNVKLYY